MKRALIGIAILLFAILLRLCSAGIDIVAFVIGMIGLIVSITSVFESET